MPLPKSRKEALNSFKEALNSFKPGSNLICILMALAGCCVKNGLRQPKGSPSDCGEASNADKVMSGEIGTERSRERKWI